MLLSFKIEKKINSIFRLCLFSAFLFGDPHIVTLDQRSYIFNGLGEYKILQIKDNEKNVFMMQVGKKYQVNVFIQRLIYCIAFLEINIYK